MNNPSIPALGTALALLLMFPPAHADEQERGRLLYENHCTSCHTSKVHVRGKHKAHTLEDIEKQVRRWSGELGLTWSDEEVAAVRSYLSIRYYGYKAD
jgi:mono/diheme cytochrome c family protein